MLCELRKMMSSDRFNLIEDAAEIFILKLFMPPDEFGLVSLTYFINIIIARQFYRSYQTFFKTFMINRKNLQILRSSVLQTERLLRAFYRYKTLTAFYSISAKKTINQGPNLQQLILGLFFEYCWPIRKRTKRADKNVWPACLRNYHRFYTKNLNVVNLAIFMLPVEFGLISLTYLIITRW